MERPVRVATIQLSCVKYKPRNSYLSMARGVVKNKGDPKRAIWMSRTPSRRKVEKRVSAHIHDHLSPT